MYSPHTVYVVFMCFVWIWEQTAFIYLYSINWLVFITEPECVYCAVRTGYLYRLQVKLGIYERLISCGYVLFSCYNCRNRHVWLKIRHIRSLVSFQPGSRQLWSVNSKLSCDNTSLVFSRDVAKRDFFPPLRFPGFARSSSDTMCKVSLQTSQGTVCFPV